MSSRKISDRSAFLLGQSQANPGYAIGDELNRLYLAGASVFGIACNTTHAEPIHQVTLSRLHPSFPRSGLVHMVNTMVERCVSAGWQRPGLLATTGTASNAIYDTAAERAGLSLIKPCLASQMRLHQAIYDPINGLKSNGANVANQNQITGIALELAAQGADVLLLACTELALIADQLSATIDLAILESSAVLIDEMLQRIDWSARQQHEQTLCV